MMQRQREETQIMRKWGNQIHCNNGRSRQYLFINKLMGDKVVQGKELKLHLGWFLRNTKGGRVVQGRELQLPSGWIL